MLTWMRISVACDIMESHRSQLCNNDDNHNDDDVMRVSI